MKKLLKIATLSIAFSGAFSLVALAEDTVNTGTMQKPSGTMMPQGGQGVGTNGMMGKLPMMSASGTRMMQGEFGSSSIQGRPMTDGKEGMMRGASSTGMMGQNEDMKQAIENRIGKNLDDARTKVASGFEQVDETLHNLLERISSRLSKIASAGQDVSSVQSLFDAATTAVTAADTELANLENLLGGSASSTAMASSSKTRNTAMTNVKSQVEKTRKAFEVARTAILKVIASLLMPDQPMNSSSTKPFSKDGMMSASGTRMMPPSDMMQGQKPMMHGSSTPQQQ